MGLGFFFITIPLGLYLFRKYCESKWGFYVEVKKKSLKNQVFIVTGSNSGLGKETVKELASRDATVIMACRNIQKAEHAVLEIRQKVKFGELIPMELDLASLTSIKNFAEKVQQDFPKVQVLINNAGVSIPQGNSCSLTADGYEINFGINHLGHFLLTNLLLEKLKQSAPSRIVIVSSKLHEYGTIDFNNLQGENGFPVGLRNPAYNNSKLANVYFCRELALRLPPGVETYALCPGFCYTELFRYSNVKWYHYLLMVPIAFVFMRSAYQGCQTILYCALSDEVSGKSGTLFRNCKPYESNKKFNDEVQRKLWSVSDKLTIKE